VHCPPNTLVRGETHSLGGQTGLIREEGAPECYKREDPSNRRSTVAAAHMTMYLEWTAGAQPIPVTPIRRGPARPILRRDGSGTPRSARGGSGR